MIQKLLCRMAQVFNFLYRRSDPEVTPIDPLAAHKHLVAALVLLAISLGLAVTTCGLALVASARADRIPPPHSFGDDFWTFFWAGFYIIFSSWAVWWVEGVRTARQGAQGRLAELVDFADHILDEVAQVFFGVLQVTVLIPHELLHVLGYRLVGKRCLYRWGDDFVTPLGSIRRRERLVGALFPFGVFLILGMLSLGLSGVTLTLARHAVPHSLGSEPMRSEVLWTLFFAGLWMYSAIQMWLSVYDLRNIDRMHRPRSAQDQVRPLDEARNSADHSE